MNLGLVSVVVALMRPNSSSGHTKRGLKLNDKSIDRSHRFWFISSLNVAAVVVVVVLARCVSLSHTLDSHG